MTPNRRKFVRRTIGYDATIFAPDGAWSCKCRVIDISQSGAKLGLDQADELPQDFVLLLSERGKPTRRCHVKWMAGDQVGVEFEWPGKGKAAA